MNAVFSKAVTAPIAAPSTSFVRKRTHTEVIDSDDEVDLPHHKKVSNAISYN